MTEQLLKIGELATRAGVSPRTVDFYTTLGLITPTERSPGNFRLYDPATVERISTIQALETHGVSLDHIAQALTNPATPDLTTALGRLDRDLHALRAATETTGVDAHGLLAAAITRAHSLITTALEIAAGVTPPV